MNLAIYIWPESDKIKQAIASNSLIHTTHPHIIHEFKSPYLLSSTSHQNIEQLHHLIEDGQLHSALSLTTVLLRQKSNVDLSSKSIQDLIELYEIWSNRFQLMLAQSMLTELDSEISAFNELDEPDTFQQFFNREYKGSLIPFSLRFIHAEIPLYSRSSYDSIVRIKRLRKHTLQAIELGKTMNLSADELDIWNGRLRSVDLLLASAFYKLQEYQISFRTYEEILRNMQGSRKFILLQLIVRLAITIGDEKRMNKYLDQLLKEDQSCSAKLHRTFKGVFFGNYKYSLDHLISLQNQHCLDQENVQSAAIQNNLAVLHLYMGNIGSSLKSLLNHKDREPLNINSRTISDLVLLK